MTNVSPKLDWRLKRKVDTRPLLDRWEHIAKWVGNKEALEEIEKRKEVQHDK